MCGLVGVFGKIDNNLKKTFENMLFVNSIRGGHSTGVAIVREKKPRPHIIKGTGSPAHLVNLENYKKLKNSNIRLMMGHGRHATLGKITAQNAHPFKIGNVTLTHNGTVHSKHKFPKGSTFDTDSEAITNAISEEGPEKTWKNLLGAAALVWWDQKAHTLKVLRNTQRPLYFCYTKDEDTLLYASEDWMITEICDRNDIELHENEKGNRVWYPPEHIMFEFKYDRKNKKLLRHSSKLKPYVYTSTNNNNYTQWYNKGRNSPIHNNTKGKTDSEIIGEMREKDISVETFKKRYPFCALCLDTLDGEYSTSLILTDYEAACAHCQNVALEHDIKLIH